jgi:hypothetical protein
MTMFPPIRHLALLEYSNPDTFPLQSSKIALARISCTPLCSDLALVCCMMAHTAIIDILSDDIFLGIFDFCVRTERAHCDSLWELREGQRLVYVCRR